MGLPEIADAKHDLFMTRFNQQLLVYILPVPDPQALDIDTLAISWEGLEANTYSPPKSATIVPLPVPIHHPKMAQLSVVSR